MSGTDLKTVEGVSAYLQAMAYDITGVAPKHVDPDAFLGMALSCVRQDVYLRTALQANPMGFVHALRQCAALGHMPMKGIVSLVAYKSRNAPGGWTIEAIEEYRGVVERMYRAGGVLSVHFAVARDKDPVLRWNPTTMVLPLHEYDPLASKAERGPLKAVWAWCRLREGGTSQVSFLNRHEVERIRSMSASVKKDPEGGGNFWGPPWPAEGPNTEPMWVKSALHRQEAVVPTSAAYRWEVAQSTMRAERPQNPDVAPFTPYRDVWDAEVVAENDSGTPPDQDNDPHSTLGRGDPGDPPRRATGERRQ
jgi:recombination protein RecT